MFETGSCCVKTRSLDQILEKKHVYILEGTDFDPIIMKLFNLFHISRRAVLSGDTSCYIAFVCIILTYTHSLIYMCLIILDKG